MTAPAGGLENLSRRARRISDTSHVDVRISSYGCAIVVRADQPYESEIEGDDVFPGDVIAAASAPTLSDAIEKIGPELDRVLDELEKGGEG